MLSAILQDGTNLFIKLDRKLEDVFKSFWKNFNLCLEQIIADHFMICEVIPKTGRICEFNVLILDHYARNRDNVMILKPHRMIKKVENYICFIMGICI